MITNHQRLLICLIQATYTHAHTRLKRWCHWSVSSLLTVAVVDKLKSNTAPVSTSSGYWRSIYCTCMVSSDGSRFVYFVTGVCWECEYLRMFDDCNNYNRFSSSHQKLSSFYFVIGEQSYYSLTWSRYVIVLYIVLYIVLWWHRAASTNYKDSVLMIHKLSAFSVPTEFVVLITSQLTSILYSSILKFIDNFFNSQIIFFFNPVEIVVRIYIRK